MLMLNKLTANYYHAFQTLFPSKNVISFEIIILIIFLTSLQLFKTFKVSMHNSKLRCWKYYINFMAKLIQLKTCIARTKDSKKNLCTICMFANWSPSSGTGKIFFLYYLETYFFKTNFYDHFYLFFQVRVSLSFFNSKTWPWQMSKWFLKLFYISEDAGRLLTKHRRSWAFGGVEGYTSKTVHNTVLLKNAFIFFFFEKFKQISNQSDHLDGNASLILEAINLFKTCPLQLQNELSIVIMFWARL